MAEVIVALDLENAAEAYRLLDRVPDVRWVKVGSMLFVREGPRVVRELVDRGLAVFLDLKWHDIPRTVAEAARGAEALGATMASVHALGGPQMMRAAVAAAPGVRLVAVTVLTSHSEAEYREVTGSGRDDLGGEARRLARQAMAAGVRGVVASAAETRMLREALGPEAWIVVPGIRPPGAPSDDQRRTAEPRAAAQAGASHLVVGRPVLRAEHPSAVYREICEAAAG